MCAAGCYFAGDSLYSNTYTDRGSTPSTGSVFLKSIMQVSTSHSTDPSYGSTASLLAPPPPAMRPSSLQLFQRSAAAAAGSSSGQAIRNMKKILMKHHHHNQALLAAYRLKQKAVAAKGVPGTATHPGGQPAHLGGQPAHPGGQLAHPGGQPAHPGGQPNAPVPGPHGGPLTVCGHRQVALYPYSKKYSLLAGIKRHQPFLPAASQAPPQGLQPAPGSQGLLGPLLTQAGSGPKAPPAVGGGPPGYAGQPGKQYAASSLASSGSLSKVSGAVMVRSSSGQSLPPQTGGGGGLMVRSSSGQSLPPQTGGGGGLMVPLGGYSAMLPVASATVTLPNALLTASPASSVQGSGYLLMSAQAPLPPPPLPLLSQPGPTKPSPWAMVVPGPVVCGQALDLRKQSSSPRYMFLAKVLTGLATGGASDLRRPPPLDPHDPLGRCYNSCVDNIYTPRIWVIFDSTQAYPEYAIEYHVNGDLYR